MTAGAVSAPFIIPMIRPPAHRPKNHIETNTPVSIQSETPGVVIFFTLDGSKPLTARGQQRSAVSTKKYTKLITLPAGRITVRAVAVTGDNRQSSVVTKVFSVSRADGASGLQQFLASGGLDAADGSRLKSTEASVVTNDSPPAGPRFLNQRFDSEPAAPAATAPDFTHTLPEGGNSLSNSLKPRLQPPVNSPQCLQCDGDHLSDPFAGFCVDCGAPFPPHPAQRTTPAERPQDHVVCVCCGTGNPAHISTCVTCESKLQVQCAGSHSASCGHRTEGPELFRSSCQHMNKTWACKCSQLVHCVMCWRCGASGSLDSHYCACCGVFLQASPSLSRDVAGGEACASRDATWWAALSAATAHHSKEALPTVDQDTQTVGLYYPSATKLDRKEQQEVLQLTREQMSRDHRPLRSAVSPGRGARPPAACGCPVRCRHGSPLMSRSSGFWRKQLDHVCTHLRSYAQNHAPFRAVLGEPRLGRVVSAVVNEDGPEVSVTLSFESVQQKQLKMRPEGGVVRRMGGLASASTLSSATERNVNGRSLNKSVIEEAMDEH